jgi:hypothetical protein
MVAERVITYEFSLLYGNYCLKRSNYLSSLSLTTKLCTIS